MNIFKEEYDEMKPKVILLFKRIYVLAFNIYAWYWLYRQIFIRHSTDFEEYLLWFFLTAGFYWFVNDHKDILLKIDKK